MNNMVYKTVYGRGAAELIEKKSRFIANVAPVHTEEEAVAFVSEIKAKYRDARHNVYAYVVAENNISRFTDDGEPAGTKRDGGTSYAGGVAGRGNP